MRYTTTDRQAAQIDRCFSYHSPKPDQPERYNELRDYAKQFALMITHNTPPGREQSIALTKLEEAVMFANAAIARNE